MQLADLAEKRCGLGRARADVGDPHAAPLTDLLIEHGRGEEAKQLRQFGLNPDESIALHENVVPGPYRG